MRADHPTELLCPAGSLPALKAAVDEGADAVYLGFSDGTNARAFPGLNFDERTAARGVSYAHRYGARVFVAVNVYPQPRGWPGAVRALETAARIGADAVISADPGLLRHAARRHPGLALHLSVQGSATNAEAITFYHERFGIERVVVPRVLSLAQVRQIVARAPVEVEAFGYGSLCVMVEGRCALSSYVTGQSPNTCGVCSPASAVRWEEGEAERRVRLGGVLINRFEEGEPAGYPTLCKGRYRVGGETCHAIEEPTSLDVLGVLPDLVEMGVAAIKVEGRQRSPAYVRDVTRVLRAALDACLEAPQRFRVAPEWTAALARHAEGHSVTLGALDRPWQ